MIRERLFIFCCVALGFGVAASSAQDAAPTKILFDREHSEFAIKPSSAQVTTEMSAGDAAPGLVVNVAAGPDGYPGITLNTKDGVAWDLSQFGHVEAQVTNLSTKPIGVHLRLDNDADGSQQPFNSESVYLQPGKSGKVSVIFGHSYGRKPSYPLKSAAIVRMLLFIGKAEETKQFRIESITAAGPAGEKPPVDPASIRVLPTNRFIFGGGAPFDLAQQVTTKEGAEASLAADGKSLRIAFTKRSQSVTIKPPQGAWDLRDGYLLRVKIKNVGKETALAGARVLSQPGPTEAGISQWQKGILSGETDEIDVSFIPHLTWQGILNSAKTEWNPTKGTGTRFISDAATGVEISPLWGRDEEQIGAAEFELESIALEAPPLELREPLGKRPPVDGDWVPTFAEEFDGDAINLSKWNIYTANYWDKQTHFSRENVFVRDGKAVLRYEKKPGRHNDAPNGKETKYASGFLDTYGKWVQRYGYFEARMKLPKAPGLWPAMWLMPDRGLAEGEQWKRADTGRGGMEFDIMEHLTRWGPYRYNIAFHWDGYGEKHQQTGSQTIYGEHDADGFITVGLLWLPGKAAIYHHGRLVAEWESSRISDVPSDLMFTHVMGGWDNNALDDAQLPAEFVIDYVRCWQRKDLASDLDGVKSAQPTPAAPTTPDTATRDKQ